MSGTARRTKELAESFRNNGHIVTISSAAGIVGASMLTDYNASKFAAFGFDESLRMEFKKRKMNYTSNIIRLRNIYKINYDKTK